MTRRRLIGGAAAAVAAGVGAGIGATGTAGAAPTAGDPFDALRASWLAAITGGTFDAKDPDYAAALKRLDADAAKTRAVIDRSAGRTQVFTDLPLGTASANVTTTHQRLNTLASAYVTAGAALAGDAGVLADVLAGLATAHDRAYNATQAMYGNWWDWQIGTPKLLNDTCVLLYDKLPADRLAQAVAAVDHFVPDPTKMAPGGKEITSTGANRVDECQVVGIRGILGRSDAKLHQSSAGLSDVFAYVNTGDGFYRDGSFVQHTHVAYTGTYGLVLLGGMAALLALYAGSSWEVTDPNRKILFDAVESTYAPVVFDDQVLDCVRGRAVSRNTESDHTDGHTAVVSILRLAPAVDAATAARWKAACLGWLRRDHFDNPLATATIPAISLIKKLRADGSVKAAPEPSGHRLFAGMDRAVHRRPGWAFAVSMASERIAYYEYGNGENVRGWHQGEGMGYLYLSGDNGQFTDAFWPTVDPYRLPGTTVDTQPLPDGVGGDFGQAVAPTAFAGGATAGGLAVLGQDVVGFRSSMHARRSWFCLDDVIVLLGGGITGGGASPVQSIVENRNLHADGGNALLVDGRRQPADLGWTAALPGTRWAHLDGVAGYVFLSGPVTLHGRREQRTGRWRDINQGGPTDPVGRRYLTLWLDHGVTPSNAGHAYLLVPGASPARTAALAATPGIHVLANSTAQQAITVPRLGLTAANLFAAGTVTGGGAIPFTADGAASVLLRRDGRELTVAIADPTHRAATRTVCLTAPGYRLVRANPTVRVSGTTCVVDTSGHDGVTHTAVFRR